jgi:hypothetical protein
MICNEIDTPSVASAQKLDFCGQSNGGKRLDFLTFDWR